MRYLVTARVKPGKEAELLRAIESGTLGTGSVAGDEYMRNMTDARLLTAVPSPSPAKTATKERIVVGLVRVSASVDPNATANPRTAPDGAAMTGCASAVRRPR